MAKIPGIDAQAAAFAASIRGQLRQAREYHGWTLRKLSERTKGTVSPRRLSRFEHGEAAFGVFEFQLVCSVLGLDTLAVLNEAQQIATATPGKNERS